MKGSGRIVGYSVNRKTISVRIGMVTSFICIVWVVFDLVLLAVGIAMGLTSVIMSGTAAFRFYRGQAQPRLHHLPLRNGGRPGSSEPPSLASVLSHNRLELFFLRLQEWRAVQPG